MTWSLPYLCLGTMLCHAGYNSFATQTDPSLADLSSDPEFPLPVHLVLVVSFDVVLNIPYLLL